MPLGLLWLGLVGLLFAWTGRFSLAAVLDACGTEAPDVLFAPSPARTESFLAGCGAPGLQAYRDLQVVDVFYPAVGAAFLAVALTLLLRDASPRLWWLAVVPVAAALGDYVENAAAWVLIGAGPSAIPWVAVPLQVGSGAKVILSWVSWLAVVTLLLGRVPMVRHRVAGRRAARSDRPRPARPTRTVADLST